MPCGWQHIIQQTLFTKKPGLPCAIYFPRPAAKMSARPITPPSGTRPMGNGAPVTAQSRRTNQPPPRPPQPFCCPAAPSNRPVRPSVRPVRSPVRAVRSPVRAVRPSVRLFGRLKQRLISFKTPTRHKKTQENDEIMKRPCMPREKGAYVPWQDNLKTNATPTVPALWSWILFCALLFDPFP